MMACQSLRVRNGIKVALIKSNFSLCNPAINEAVEVSHSPRKFQQAIIVFGIFMTRLVREKPELLEGLFLGINEFKTMHLFPHIS